MCIILLQIPSITPIKAPEDFITKLNHEFAGKRSFCPKATVIIKGGIWRENPHTFI
jgi:hypothetical protein